MRATYLALQEYGYAGLSIQRIADEADLSKSTFYHHFDDKEDLLFSFLEYILAEFMRLFSLGAGDDPGEQLETFLDLLLDSQLPPEERGRVPDKEEVLRTYVQLRAQAAQHDSFREKFTETDRRFREQLTDIVEAGVEDGTFREVDPDATAEFLLTLAAGHVMRLSTREDDPASALRDELDAYLQQRVYR